MTVERPYPRTLSRRVDDWHGGVAAGGIDREVFLLTRQPFAGFADNQGSTLTRPMVLASREEMFPAAAQPDDGADAAVVVALELVQTGGGLKHRHRQRVHGEHAGRLGRATSCIPCLIHSMRYRATGSRARRVKLHSE